ncbi:MAG: sulfite exporter TauE/SafE family protein [Armatimonadetes bacterium]|nr:sulfite exporter TauE/SafE family protein [Armatimonadota bacterium]
MHLELFLLGLIIGAYGTLIGIGGGVFFVPIFIIIYKLSPQTASGTSLLIVFLNAFSGSMAYFKQKRVDKIHGFQFALYTIPGAILGAYFCKFLSLKIYNFIFGILLLILAIFLFIKPKEEEMIPPSNLNPLQKIKKIGQARKVILIDQKGRKFKYTFSYTIGVIFSFFIGFISSLLGVGGGIFHVPMMIYYLSFPSHIAIATSHFILMISAFFGSLSHILLGHILIRYVLPMGLGALIGAQIGAKISLNSKSILVLRLLALAIFLVAVYELMF